MAATTGLHLRLHFNSSQLTLDSLSDMLPTGFSSEDVQSEPDCGSAECGGFDGDPNTDVYVNVLWIATAGDWPAVEPARLLTANFTVAESFTGQTRINFSGNPAADFELVAPALVLESARLAGDMDIDGCKTIDGAGWPDVRRCFCSLRNISAPCRILVGPVCRTGSGPNPLGI